MPIERFQNYLVRKGIWDADKQQELLESTRKEVNCPFWNHTLASSFSANNPTVCVVVFVLSSCLLVHIFVAYGLVLI